MRTSSPSPSSSSPLLEDKQSEKKSFIEREGNKCNDLNEKTMNDYFTYTHSHISSNETKKKILSLFQWIYDRNHFTSCFFEHKTIKINLRDEVILYNKYLQENCMMIIINNIIRTLSSMCSWHVYLYVCSELNDDRALFLLLVFSFFFMLLLLFFKGTKVYFKLTGYQQTFE